MILDTLEVNSNWWIYQYRIELFFSSFFTDQNPRPIFNKNQLYGHVTKIPYDGGLLFVSTTEVNGNDP